MTPALDANRRILIVDDNPDIHDDFRKLLGCEGADRDLDDLAAEVFDLPAPRVQAPSFELSFAFQGAEGYEMITQHVCAGIPYALVFMDMRMPPGWDGLETLERIWAFDPSIQAVICTAYSDYSWEQINERLGPTDRLLVLKKPFDSLEVRQLALAMTEKWNEHRERERTEAHLRAALRELASPRRSDAPSAPASASFGDDRRTTLADMPLPVVPVREGVIVVPLVGEHDAARMELVAGALVSTVLSRSARALVLDGSCLAATGEQAALGVAMATHAVQATGCEVVLSGMPFPSVEPEGGPLCCDGIDDAVAHAIAIAAARAGRG